MSGDLPFWEQAENVERFAAREPDHRLIRWLDEHPAPTDVRALDLGCAGGRNTVALAERGCSVRALDSSHAMVEKTRHELVPILGAEEARRSVVLGSMVDLSEFADELFDLVVALGIYHNAKSRDEWAMALAETSRVLAPGGYLLVAVFTPETDLTGEGVTPAAGEAHVYEGFPSGRAVLVDAVTLDAEMGHHGLVPVVPSETVTTPTENGQRVTVNALLRKEGAPPR